MAPALHALLLGALFSDEVDAVSRREWRLYVLRAMPEDDARTWFTLIHMPLFSAVLGGSFGIRKRAGAWGRVGVAAFRILHAGLHLRLARHPRNEFRGPLSWGLIHGGAVLGAVSLLMVAT